MKRIQLCTLLAISLASTGLFASEQNPNLRDALASLFGGSTTEHTTPQAQYPAQTQPAQSASIWDALKQAMGAATTEEARPQPTYTQHTAQQQPGLWDMLKGALGGTTAEQEVSQLSKEQAVLTQKQSEFSQKINDLAKQVPGGEKLLSYFQPFLGALEKKAEDVNLKLTSLNPTAEGLQGLQAKIADLTKQRDALAAQLQQVKQGPNDMFSNMFAGAIKSALSAINLNIDTIKPIIALVMSKLGVR